MFFQATAFELEEDGFQMSDSTPSRSSSGPHDTPTVLRWRSLVVTGEFRLRRRSHTEDGLDGFP